MNFFYAPDIRTTPTLSEEESVHCSRVLRHQVGDKIGILDGIGGSHVATIEKIERVVHVDILSSELSNTPSYTIHLAVSPTKNMDRMEWMVEKLTEIGISEITFFYCQNSERRKLRMDRIEKKMVSALKQSKNPFIPQVNKPVEFQSLLTDIKADERLIAYVDANAEHRLYEKINPGSSSLIMIGPEGDFTQKEVSLAVNEGFQKISLGSNVLRTETAALVAAHTVQLINFLKED